MVVYYLHVLLITERLLKLIDYYEGSFQDFTGHNDSVQTVKFSPDGKLLFTASHSEIFIWDVTLWNGWFINYTRVICDNVIVKRIFLRKTGEVGPMPQTVANQEGVQGVRLNPLARPQFLNIPWKWNNLVSLRPNYFIFMGYLRQTR